jgi:hypothetical protein
VDQCLAVGHSINTKTGHAESCEYFHHTTTVKIPFRSNFDESAPRFGSTRSAFCFDWKEKRSLPTPNENKKTAHCGWGIAESGQLEWIAFLTGKTEVWFCRASGSSDFFLSFNGSLCFSSSLCFLVLTDKRAKIFRSDAIPFSGKSRTGECALQLFGPSAKRFYRINFYGNDLATKAASEIRTSYALTNEFGG